MSEQEKAVTHVLALYGVHYSELLGSCSLALRLLKLKLLHPGIWNHFYPPAQQLCMSLSVLLFLTVSPWGLAWTCALFPVTWVSLGSWEPCPISHSGTESLSSPLSCPFLWVPGSPYNLSVLMGPRNPASASHKPPREAVGGTSLVSSVLSLPSLMKNVMLACPLPRSLTACLPWHSSPSCCETCYDRCYGYVAKSWTWQMHWSTWQIITRPLNLNSCFSLGWLGELRQLRFLPLKVGHSLKSRQRLRSRSLINCKHCLLSRNSLAFIGILNVCGKWECVSFSTNMHTCHT